MRNKKTYKCTKQVQYLYMKWQAVEMLFNAYVKENNHERACQAAMDCQNAELKFWTQCYRLYPKLANTGITYSVYNNELYYKSGQ